VTFYLGTHEASWLHRTSVPLCVSAVRLRRRRRFPLARCAWVLDSGGFSEIAAHGRWTVPPGRYAAEVRRWRNMGGMVWAAIQDWMCEAVMLNKTGLTVEEHQRRTVASYVDLLSREPGVSWLPVLQGFTREEYHRCLDMYEAEGLDLASLAHVGIGSVCRRQGTREAVEIIRSLHDRGLANLHGFGFKTSGLVGPDAAAEWLRSADSMAWSDAARKDWRHRSEQNCGGVGSHPASCSNCWHWAHQWRAGIVERLPQEAAT